MWTLKKAHRIGELSAAIAVVLSLLFLGYELRQNNRRQIQATTQTLVSQYTSMLTLLAENTELTCAFSNGIRDYSGLSGIEALKFSAFMNSQFRFREDLYFQFLDGAVEPEIWNGFDANTREMARWPGVQQWFTFRRSWYSERFQSYIDDLIGPPAELVPLHDPACSADDQSE